MSDALTRQQVLELVFSKWEAQPQTEIVPLRKAGGRIAAREYLSQYNIPVVRASGMDGLAVKGSRFAGDMPDTESWHLGTDYVRADTGDDFPDEFDTVIAIEDVELLPEGGIRIREGTEITEGMNVRGSGSSLKKGIPVTTIGMPLRAVDLAAAGMGGYGEIEVYRKPRVTFIPTGTELVDVGTPLERGCNYNTNGLMAVEMLREMGAEAIEAPMVPDDPEQLRSALFSALETSDIVIINGGSSKGSEDFNTGLLASEGELLFHWVLAGPGRPMSIAMVQGKPVINLAGPAIGAFYGMDWCIRPLVCRLLNIPVPKRVLVTGPLTGAMSGARHVEFIHRLEVYRSGEGYKLKPLERGEADLPSIMRTNAMYISPIGEGRYQAGDVITAELLRDPSLLPVWEEQ